MIRKRAFTLIELLVVIAIIAILAAILFPVFAQAKQSAKGAASISNDKQVTLGSQMYSADYSDVSVPDMDWGNPNKDMLGWNWAGGECYAPWGWLILPYVKTADIYMDPLTHTQPIGWNSVPVTYSEFPEYGYNYTAWSPSVWGVTTHKWGFDLMTRNPLSVSSVARPANTVLFTTKWNWDEGDGVWWYWGLGTMWAGRYTVEPPDCGSIPPACISNWGTGTWLADTVIKDNAANGAFTGGVTFRRAGQTVVSWGDGHVTTQPAGKLAAGTNWNPNIANGDLVQTDSSKYQWYIN